MSDEPKKRPRAWLVWAVIAAFCLAYPLSMGPAIKYFGSPESTAVLDVYNPVLQICELWSPLKSLKNWYNDLWGVGYDQDLKKGTRTMRLSRRID
jgi:hypothetical protein